MSLVRDEIDTTNLKLINACCCYNDHCYCDDDYDYDDYYDYY